MTTSHFEVQEEKRDRRGRQITPVARRTALVEGYRASGMTMEQYAKTEGVKRHTLAKWVYLHGQSTCDGRHHPVHRRLCPGQNGGGGAAGVGV